MYIFILKARIWIAEVTSYNLFLCLSLEAAKKFEQARSLDEPHRLSFGIHLRELIRSMVFKNPRQHMPLRTADAMYVGEYVPTT